MDYNFSRITNDDKQLSQIRILLSEAFPGKNKFTLDYLHWQYFENPLGEVVGFNALTDNKVLAAHYATIPIRMNISGKNEIGLLSLNTATHPDHRGKRLFTILAEKTYEYAKAQGFKFIVGVANANSTHGFLKKLGFYLISPLSVKVGIGDAYREGFPSDKNYVYYDSQTLQWRLRCPEFQYSIRESTIYGSINKPLFHTVVGHIPNDVEVSKLDLGKTFDIFNLYVGIGIEPKGLYMNLPKFIKRSPFNLIFKDLTDGDLPILTKDNTIFQLLDYDVA